MEWLFEHHRSIGMVMEYVTPFIVLLLFYTIHGQSRDMESMRRDMLSLGKEVYSLRQQSGSRGETVAMMAVKKIVEEEKDLKGSNVFAVVPKASV